MSQYAFYKAWLPEFGPQNLHGRTRNIPKKTVLWPLYAPCSTNTLPHSSNKWDPVPKKAVGVLEGNVLDCSLASTRIYMHICIFTRTHTQKKITYKTEISSSFSWNNIQTQKHRKEVLLFLRICKELAQGSIVAIQTLAHLVRPLI